MARNDLPPPSAANFQQRLRETVMTYLGKQGDPLDRGLTLRDLIEAGIVKVKSGFVAGGTTGAGALPLDPGAAVYLEDLTPPPSPTGFTASASTVNVMFETDAPRFIVGNGHLKTVIYGVAYTTGDPLPTFSSAVKVTEFPGNVFAHPLDPGSKWRYWATWVTNDGVEGLPSGGTNGIEATTDLIDDAKIANLSASKITAGQISVGQYIESASYVPNTSGWRINGNGTAYLVNAEMSGTVWASAGQIGGITIASNAVRAGQTGFDTGNGFYLGADGAFSLGNGTQRLTWSGSALTIKGSLDGATGTFSGALSAATGTFAGALSAATGTFSGSLSAATGTFSGSLSAATGTFSGSLTASAVNAVDTINLAGNSVTVPDASETISDTLIDSTDGEVVLASVTVNAGGQPIWATASGGTSPVAIVGGGEGGESTATPVARLYVDGVLASESSVTGSYTLTTLVSGGTSRVFELRAVSVVVGPGAVSSVVAFYGGATLFALGVKR